MGQSTLQDVSVLRSRATVACARLRIPRLAQESALFFEENLGGKESNVGT